MQFYRVRIIGGKARSHSIEAFLYPVCLPLKYRHPGQHEVTLSWISHRARLVKIEKMHGDTRK